MAAESSASAAATLEDIVAAYDVRGSGGLGPYRDRPALLHCGGEGTEKVFGFETRAVEAPWHARVALSLARSDLRVQPETLVQVTTVYPLLKRPGGPFPERIGVGRTRQADVTLRAPSISKYHAYFTFDSQGSVWSVVDARSRNGTWVGKQRVSSGESMRLEDGVFLLLGEESFLFFSAEGFHNLLNTLSRPK